MRDTPSTRRDVLTAGVAATLGLAGCAGSDPSSNESSTEPETTSNATADTESTSPPGAVETVVSIPGERVPENLAFGPDGSLYFGITAGELWRLDTSRIDQSGLQLEDTTQRATVPGAIGVEVTAAETAYVAAATQDADGGIWEVSPAGEASQLVEMGGFPNDILADSDRDRLLVTESFGGTIEAVSMDGTRTTWLEDDRLSTEAFGANGITVDETGTVSVAVTRAGDAGRLLEVPIRDDGSAGDATVRIESEAIQGADGITAHDGDVYVAVNSQNRVVRIDETDTIETVADGEDGLVFPSDVLVAPDASALFICSFANQSPEDGAIHRMRL